MPVRGNKGASLAELMKLNGTTSTVPCGRWPKLKECFALRKFKSISTSSFLLTKSDEELDYFIEHHKWPGPNEIKQIGSGTTTTGNPGETGTSLER